MMYRQKRVDRSSATGSFARSGENSPVKNRETALCRDLTSDKVSMKLQSEPNRLPAGGLKDLFSLEKSFLFALVCFTFLSVTGFGLTGFCAESEPKESSLTMARAVEVALANSPKPQQAIQAILVAENQYEKFKAELYPNLRLSGSSSLEKLDYTKANTPVLEDMEGRRGAQVALEARYTLYDGFFTKFYSLVSFNRLESEKYNKEDVRRLLAEAVKISYNNVLLVAREIEINKNDLAFQERMLHDSRLKRAADLVAEPNVLNFLLRRNQARRNLLARQHDFGLQRIVLAKIMGLPEAFLSRQIKLVPVSLEQIKPLNLAPVESYLAAARKQRPDLFSLTASKKSASYLVKTEKSKYSPTLTLVGKAGYYDNKTYYKQYNDISTGYNQCEGLVLFSWDLYDAGSRKYGVSAASANVKKIESQIAEKWLAIASEVRTSHAQIQKALELYAISLENIDIQKKQRELVTEQFKAGEVNLSFLNDTQRELVKLELELAISEFSIVSGIASLESALGIISEKSPLLTHNLW